MGFSQEDALTVAAVNQGMDDSVATVANHGPGGAVPKASNQWLWHALDRLGNMKAKGIVRRKELLFQVALTRGTRKEKLRHLGVFFHYQQDTWAHRQHYAGRPHSRNAFMTYATPVGHAMHGSQPDRPPFDPVAAHLALEETIKYARQFLIRGLKQQPGAFYQTDIEPFTGTIRDYSWRDRRKGKFFHMLGYKRAPETDQQMFLIELIKKQIEAYTVSRDGNPHWKLEKTANLADLERVRLALQSVVDKYAARLGLDSFRLPTKKKKELEQASWRKSYGRKYKLTNPNLVTTAAFTKPAGQNNSATSVVGLAVNQEVSLNGKTRWIIKSDRDARVRWIWLDYSEGLDDYKLHVTAQAPKGAAYVMWLIFTDADNNKHCLSIYDRKLKTHELGYKSANPTIKKIEWKVKRVRKLSGFGKVAANSCPKA